MPQLTRSDYEKLMHAEHSLDEISSVDVTLRTILSEATRLCDAEEGSILLHEPQEDHLVFHTVIGKYERKLKGRTVRMGEGVAGHVAQTRVPEVVSQVRKDPRFASRFDTLLDHHTRSLIAAPILHRDRLLGVLELVNHRKSPSFPSELLPMIAQFCERASGVLHASMELQEARFNADRWRALYELSYQGEDPASPLDAIIGNSSRINQIKEEIRQVAVAPTTVLIRGETGTGKELVAHAIHELCSRKKEPYVRVNCGALPGSLIESELFGHEKGAFTGAFERRLGRFELANGGTLFLDEIGDLPLDLQVKLLRVLQQQEFERIGGRETIKVNVRVIAATHVNLEANLGRQMRPDLYYRLNVFPIVLPPLRDRPEDIPLLAHYFLEKHNRRLNHSVRGFTKSVHEVLMKYDWPGNIRELETVIERAIILCQGRQIEQVLLTSSSSGIRKGSSIRQTVDGLDPLPKTLAQGVTQYKKRIVERVLDEMQGNQTSAAKRLGIAAPNFSRLMKQLGIRKQIY